jgi:WD40 repeat protein
MRGDKKDPLRDEYVLLDLDQSKEIKLDTPDSRITALDFSPRGGLLASVTSPDAVYVRRLDDLSIVATIPVESEWPPTLLQYNAEGNLLFIGSNPARVYDVDAGEFLPGDMPLPTPVCRAAFTAEDRQIVCSRHVINLVKYSQYTDSYLSEIGVDDAKPLPGMKETVGKTKLDADEFGEIELPDGSVLNRHKLEVRARGKVVRRLSPLPMALGRVCVSSDGRMVACLGGRAGLIACYALADLATWSAPRTNGGPPRPVWSRDGAYVTLVGRNASDLTVHSVRDRKPASSAIAAGLPIQDAAFSPDDKTLVIACGTPGQEEIPGEIQFWDWRAGTQTGKSLSFKWTPQSLQFHPKDDWLAIAFPDGARVLRMELEDQKFDRLARVAMNTTDDFDRIFFSADGRWLVCRGKDTVWCVSYVDRETGQYHIGPCGAMSRKISVSAGATAC